MEKVRSELTKTQKARMKNAQEWTAADETLKGDVDAHQQAMLAFQADLDKYQEDESDLLERKKEFDAKVEKFEEAMKNHKDNALNDDEVKQQLSDESDRVRQKKKEVEAKIEKHNTEHDELAKRRDEIIADGQEFGKFQEELKTMQEEIGPMVQELQEMQAKVQALAAEKKMEEAQKLQDELKSKHAVYAEKDKIFKVKVAEY